MRFILALLAEEFATCRRHGSEQPLWPAPGDRAVRLVCQGGSKAVKTAQRWKWLPREVVQSYRVSTPDLTMPWGTWSDLIDDTALSEMLTRDCLKSLSGWIFLWFRKISAATYREKNEVKEYPLTLVPTHQPLTSAAFASTAESACWHCLHQRAGCLKYQRGCPASAPLSHSYKCNRVLWAQVSDLLLVAWQAIPGCCRLFLIHY